MGAWAPVAQDFRWAAWQQSAQFAERRQSLHRGRPPETRNHDRFGWFRKSMRSVGWCFLKRVRGSNRKILLFHAMRRMGYPAFGTEPFLL